MNKEEEFKIFFQENFPETKKFILRGDLNDFGSEIKKRKRILK